MAMSPYNDPQGASAVIYLRVSSKEQAEKGGEAEGFSIPAQREGCKRKAQSLEAVLVEEFVERGESAKTADRPELQRMLAFLAEHPVKYVIVHKVDRLARNRADDVAINLAIHQAGAELVSVSENIDQTPSGLLLHGIMSSIAEFYSRNLATEVIKGSVQKAKNGGTPGRAPIGYLNVRRMENGREVRTVEIDPERGPLMTWAFEAYATGEWTIRRLLDELTARGLQTVPGPRSGSKPLVVSNLHRLLRHPYYIGMVRYRGAIYPGKHKRLVEPEVWHEVQKLLTAKNYAGEKQREHPHYLKGSIYCGQCGARLIVNYAKGRRGGIYPYFICIGRQKRRTSCTQRAIRIEQAEAAIAAYYATVQLPKDEVARLRVYLGEELSKLRTDSERDRAIQTHRLRKLEGERKKLLDAHYADAVPLDLLKSEQDRIATELANAEGRLAEIEADFQTAEANLERALTRAGDCEAAYREAEGNLRRQFNLAFFRRLLIDDECTVRGELAEPFDVILGDDLRRAAVVQADRELQETVKEALRRRAAEGQLVQNDQHPREPERPLVGAGTPAPSQGEGWNAINLVHRMRHRHRDFGFAPHGPHGGPRGGFGPGGRSGGPFGRGRKARRGDIRTAALLLLAEEPRNGYQIMQELEERTDGAWRPSPGSVYPALAQLEDEGLIRSGERDGRKHYELTDAGHAHLRERDENAPAPWEQIGGDLSDQARELSRLMREVADAFVQVMRAGGEPQWAQARAVLANARRDLYRILADGDGDSETDGDQTGGNVDRDA